MLSDAPFIDPLITLRLPGARPPGRTAEGAEHPPLAGLETFGLASLLGAVAAVLSSPLGVWVVVAGLLGVLGVLGIGNAILIRLKDATPGQTTEVAMLVMHLLYAVILLAVAAAEAYLGSTGL